jgi:hypothetical protein
MPQDTTPLDNVRALLYKIGEYLVDPRTAITVVTVVLALNALGVFKTEVDKAQVTSTLKVLADAAFALANVASILVPVWKWVDGITNRPPRGLEPWLSVIRAKRNLAPKG